MTDAWSQKENNDVLQEYKNVRWIDETCHCNNDYLDYHQTEIK